MIKTKPLHIVSALFVFALFALGVSVQKVGAQETELNETGPTYVSLSVENDNFGGNSDRYYTSGVRLTWFNAGIKVPPLIDEMADRIPTFDLNETTSTFFTLGQNIYTPKDIKIVSAQNDDRPWAGYLYGSVGLATITYNESVPAHIDELEFTLGVVGPASLAEPTQKFVHDYVTNSPEPKGWDHQLKNEPGLTVSWMRRMPFALSYENNYFATRFEPNMGVTLGNIHTYAQTGATVIIGSSNELDTPPRVRPSPPGTGVFQSDKGKLDWQVFAGADLRLVGRNIFLDGNTFSDSHSVDKKYLVGDYSVGTSLLYDDYRLSYSLNARTKEFDQQDEKSIYGSVTLTKRF